jgi:hypothetical protein
VCVCVCVCLCLCMCVCVCVCVCVVRASVRECISGVREYNLRLCESTCISISVLARIYLYIISVYARSTYIQERQ